MALLAHGDCASWLPRLAPGAGRYLARWQVLTRSERAEIMLSGWRDSNSRPPDPQSGALPGCATARGGPNASAPSVGSVTY